MHKSVPRLSVEEFQARYELEPTMLENLLASQEAYKAMGLDLNLESVYAVEIDPPQNQAEDEETEQESTPPGPRPPPSPTPHPPSPIPHRPRRVPQG